MEKRDKNSSRPKKDELTRNKKRQCLEISKKIKVKKD